VSLENPSSLTACAFEITAQFGSSSSGVNLLISYPHHDDAEQRANHQDKACSASGKTQIN
jgi:hypothetical protein